MLSQDSYRYIKIGLALRLLINVNDHDSSDFVSEAIKSLASDLKSAEFNVSLAYTNSDSYGDMIKILEKNEKSTEIGQTLKNEIRRHFSTLEHVVFSEAITKKIYILPTRRFNTDYLLNHPGQLLKDGVFEKLDEIAQSDISSACKCLLFGEATAAAFHILRATESVLKSYYFVHRKQMRLDKPMWGQMVDQLKAKTKNRPPEILLSSLDIIRSAYRNPTQHPQAVYQIDSAQDLFGVCFDVIGKMGEEL
jgi:hypothetical protein